MLALSSSVLGFAPIAPALSPAVRAPANVRMETVADLKVLAEKCNPKVGYYNPTSLAEMDFWGQGQEATIGFLRQAEIKHGRVAMAAFVGFVLQANGVHFPWGLSLDGTSFADISAAGGPADQWDALPTNSKLQIIGFVGFLEWWSENSWALAQSGEKHYMRGGKPGAFPSLKRGIPHPVPFDLFDPFGFSKNASPEANASGLVKEINNGRLAMLGIFGFVAESKVPGSVPALSGLIKPYSGEVMAPFSAGDTILPYVENMLKVQIF